MELFFSTQPVPFHASPPDTDPVHTISRCRVLIPLRPSLKRDRSFPCRNSRREPHEYSFCQPRVTIQQVFAELISTCRRRRLVVDLRLGSLMIMARTLWLRRTGRLRGSGRAGCRDARILETTEDDLDAVARLSPRLSFRTALPRVYLPRMKVEYPTLRSFPEPAGVVTRVGEQPLYGWRPSAYSRSPR